MINLTHRSSNKKNERGSLDRAVSPRTPRPAPASTAYARANQILLPAMAIKGLLPRPGMCGSQFSVAKEKLNPSHGDLSHGGCLLEATSLTAFACDAKYSRGRWLPRGDTLPIGQCYHSQLVECDLAGSDQGLLGTIDCSSPALAWLRCQA